MRSYGGALPARHILGNYELFEEIGRGGMGIVYRALDLSLDRVVAVKILRDDLRTQPQIVSRFNREAKAAACLDHPNIVQIYAVGNVDGTPYIAMEYVDAAPLSALMQRESNMDWDQALDIARQVAAALACAHDSHVIHRDIKPPNILITDEGRAYVTDFGIAKILTSDDHLTIDGSRLGTPHYMSPERCKNGDLTGASDLYSLGVLLFQMLSGRLPYEAASSIELIRRIVSEPPYRLRQFRPDLPEQVEHLVAWMIEKQPKYRPPDGRIVVEAIQRVRQGRSLDTNTGPMLSVLADYRQASGRAMSQRSVAPPQRLASGLTPITEVLPLSWRRKIRLAGIAALCAIPVLLAVFHVIRGETTLDSAVVNMENDPSLWFVEDQVAEFQDEATGVVRARLNLPGYAISSAGWTGAPGALVVQLDRASDAHHEGRRTMCAVMPEPRRASIVVPPELSLHNAEGIPPIAALAFPHHVVAGSRFAGRWLADVAYLEAEGRTPSRVLAACPTDGTDAAGPVLLHVLPEAARASVAAVHPNGLRVAVALATGSTGERVVEWTQPVGRDLSAERTLIPAGAPVIAMQYSPDGARLAILRKEAAGRQALWIVSASAVSAETAPIMEGDLTLGSRAFSPNGRLLAVAETREDGPSRVLLVRTEDGRIEAELGEGVCASWHGARNALVLISADRKSTPQLWAVEATATHRRFQLTHLERGVQPPCDLSEDGAWAVSVSGAEELPSLVFVDLRARAF